jgi:hypothetical protein
MIRIQGKFGIVNRKRSGMAYTRLMVAVLVVVLFSCDKEPEVTTRPFRMGFATIPRSVSSRTMEYTFSQLAADADITNHQFDRGVPWEEALSGAPFHASVLKDWIYRKSQTPTGHKVLVSAASVRAEGNGIAKYLGEKESMDLPAPWDKYSFKDAAVRTGYLNYCKRLIRFFNPDYFNMNVDANVLYFRDPAQWKDFLGFHSFIYKSLKTEFPSLTIFSSIAASPMLPGAFIGNDHVKQKLAALQLMENSDLYALSFKSGKSLNYSDNTFAALFSICNKPLAIAETEFDVFPVDEKINSTIAGELEKPKFISALLKESELHKATFVINFALKNRDAIAKQESYSDHTALLRKICFYGETGIEKQPVTVWKNYQKRAFKP